MNQIELTMEMFNLSVRRLANGNKIRVIFEIPEDKDQEKQLIDFRGDNVKVMLNDKNDKTFIFEVFEIKCRKLRNGNKLSLILEKLYDKEDELFLVNLREDDVKIFMERIEPDLPGLENDDNDITDLYDSENGENV
jgi:hypothetical protein